MNVGLIFISAKANLASQISQTYFGWLWWVVEPIMTMLVYYFVFEFLLNRGGPNFIYMLLTGVVVWAWFGNTVSNAATSILREKGTISCINLPKEIFPFISILECTFRQLIVFVVFFVFMLATKGVSLSWLYLPLVLLEQFLFVSALSIMIAGLVPFFPDINFVVTVFLRAAMFCSGVFYTVDMMPEDIQGHFMFNPMANIIEQYRAILMNNQGPDIVSVFVIMAVSLLILLSSIVFIRTNNQKYPRLVIQ